MADPQALYEEATEANLFSSLKSGNIEFDDNSIYPGNAELALLQHTINEIAARNVAFIISPIHDDWFPLTACFTYHFYSQQNPDWFNINKPYPSLLCGRRGYLQQFDQFQHKHAISGGTVVDREPLAPTDFTQAPILYSTLDPEILDYRDDTWGLGNVFVDLRSNKWQNALLRFNDFNEHHHVCSYTFYADSEWLADRFQKELPNQELVTRDWLQAVDSPTENTASPTLVRTYEQLLHTDRSIEFLVLNDDTFLTGLESLYHLHKQIQDEYAGHVQTGRLFRELSTLAATPSSFDTAAANEYTQPKLATIIESIEDKAQDATGGAKGLLGRFVDEAHDLINHLKSTNSKRTRLTALIEDLKTSDTHILVVAKNPTHERAIRAEYQNGCGLPANVSIQAASEAEPAENQIVVLTGLMPRTSAVYEFPLAPDYRILCYPIEKEPIERRLNITDSDTDSSIESHSRPAVSMSTIENTAEPTTVNFDLDDITESISQEILEQTSTSTGTRSPSTGGQDTIYEITYTNGETETKPGSRRVTRYNPSTQEVDQCPVRNLSSTDQVVRLEDAKEDLFDYLRRVEKKEGGLETKEELVDFWRNVLAEAREETSLDAIQSELAAHGSTIKSEQAIRYWISGKTIGPSDPEDVGRVLEAYRPDLVDITDDVLKAMNWLRNFNEEIGNEIHRMLIGQLDATTSLDIGSSLRQKVMSLREEIEVIQVEDVRER